MTIIIQTPVESEFLSQEEIRQLTGYNNTAKQIDWLKDPDRAWQFVVNNRHEVQISRWYFRLKMAGMDVRNIDVTGPCDDDGNLPRLDLVG